MRSFRIVVDSPLLNDVSGTVKVDKHIVIQTLISVLAVKAFNISILYWLSGLNKSKPYIVLVCPKIKRFTYEFRAVVNGNDFWYFLQLGHTSVLWGRSILIYTAAPAARVPDSSQSLCLYRLVWCWVFQ